MAEEATKLLTISQAAARIGVHQNTLRTWVDKGLVPATRLPSGYRRFSLEQVEAIKQSMLEGKRAA
jgi:putative resolvase